MIRGFFLNPCICYFLYFAGGTCTRKKLTHLSVLAYVRSLNLFFKKTRLIDYIYINKHRNM